VADLRIVDILDEQTFALIPLCADPRFDHRTCDYWEDADRGAKEARPSWLKAAPAAPPPPRPASDNPFAPSVPGGDRRRDALAALLGDDDTEPMSPSLAADDPSDVAPWNPFATAPAPSRELGAGVPRKLGLLTRGARVFGSYARVALVDDRAVAYAQFGPLSAYPRAQRLRDLYPQLPAAPLPAVISCIATTAEARRQGHAAALVGDVCAELGRRGFAAVEVYPDLTLPEDATSTATPAFWRRCDFELAVADERFPVFRRELG
jgi:ribosomal protein S18 acetylase RimI-like enzyme